MHRFEVCLHVVCLNAITAILIRAYHLTTSGPRTHHNRTAHKAHAAALRHAARKEMRSPGKAPLAAALPVCASAPIPAAPQLIVHQSPPAKRTALFMTASMSCFTRPVWCFVSDPSRYLCDFFSLDHHSLAFVALDSSYGSSTLNDSNHLSSSLLSAPPLASLRAMIASSASSPDATIRPWSSASVIKSKSDFAIPTYETPKPGKQARMYAKPWISGPQSVSRVTSGHQFAEARRPISASSAQAPVPPSLSLVREG
jgi:hypothetical protein